MAENEQREVTLEGLEASLQDLVKAAEATDLAKAYGGTSVEWSGHSDERGKVSGGGAEASDMGGLDDMMIGKLIEAGLPADMVSEFAGFMAAKQRNEEPEEEEEEEEEGKAGHGMVSHGRPAPSGTAKSMDAYRADKDVADAIDVSPFLEALTARTADQLDGIRKSQDDFAGHQAFINKHVAAAVAQIGGLVKSQAMVINELGQRLGIIERTPQKPRGATSTPQAQALAKALPGEVGEGGGDLSKSEVVSALSYMNIEKGIRQINGQKTSEVIGLLEGGSVISQETVDTVRSFLRTHPNEAKAARTYA